MKRKSRLLPNLLTFIALMLLVFTVGACAPATPAATEATEAPAATEEAAAAPTEAPIAEATEAATAEPTEEAEAAPTEAVVEATEAPAEASAEAVTIRLAYFPNLTHAAAVVGVGRNTFQEALGSNVTLDIKTFNAGPALIEALFAGEIDLGYIGPNPAINGYVKSNGEALRIIAGASSAGALFIVRPEANIKEGKDLDGKKFATPQLGGTQDVALRNYVVQSGLETADKGGTVEIIPTQNPDILTLFKEGEIDGAWVPEPWATRLIQEGGGEVFIDEKTLWPEGKFVTTHIIASTKFLNEHPDVVKAFLSAHVDTVEWINANPDEAKKVVNSEIERITSKPLPTEVLDAAFENVEITYDPVSSSLLKSAEDAFNLGFLGDAKPDLSGIYDLSILEEVLKEKNLTLAAAEPTEAPPPAEAAATEEAAAAAPVSTEPVTLRLGFFPNLTHAAPLVGLARNTFQETLGPDVTLDIKTFNAGPAVIEALFAGEIDISYIGPNPAINGYVKSNGEALRIIAGATSAGALFVVRPEANIKEAKDLDGKKFATPQLGNTQDVALRSYLLANGLETADKGGTVEIIPTQNPDILTLFKEGEIDGAWVPEPWGTRLIQEGGGEVFIDEKTLWPEGKFVTTHIIASTKFLTEHPDVVKAFLSAHVDTVEWINANPNEAKQLVNSQIEAITGKALPTEVLDAAYENLEITYDPISSSLLKSAEDAFSLGFLGETQPDLSGIYDLSILEEVLAEKNLKL